MTDRTPIVETGVEHRFGPYGGQYVPETLMPALTELEAAWVAMRHDEGYKA
ncbi:MAG: tryptophan synthase beta chain, partial [Solirubrobacteraceae bacterium]|nr:tryptophan synthase beta chain [Solirubrobacteraceae bacterium]